MAAHQLPERWDAEIRQAIEDVRLVGIRYKGVDRRAEPHDYGVMKGVPRLFVFQVESAPGSENGWKLLHVDRIEALVVLDERFAGSRNQPGQTHMEWDVIYCRVK